MKEILRKIWRTLGGVCCLIFAAVIVSTTTMLTAYFNLNFGQRGFLVVSAAIGVTALVVLAVDIFHKTWKKEELDE